MIIIGQYSSSSLMRRFPKLETVRDPPVSETVAAASKLSYCDRVCVIKQGGGGFALYDGLAISVLDAFWKFIPQVFL